MINKQELEEILDKDFPIIKVGKGLKGQLNKRLGYMFGQLNENPQLGRVKGVPEVFQLNYGMYATLAKDNNNYFEAVDILYNTGVLPVVGNIYLTDGTKTFDKKD